MDWLVHFHTIPEEISRNGFKYGVNDFNKLWRTNRDLNNKGYNFAYLWNDIPWDNSFSGKFGYGDGAVMFKANGIYFHHNDDDENQVIFWGEDAIDIIPIYHGDDWTIERELNVDDRHKEQISDSIWYVINKETSRILYYSEELENIVRWVIKNYNQYKNKLI